MAEKLNLDFLPHKNDNERQWVVRASSGAFVRHFIEHGVVAIGHLNHFKEDDDLNKLTFPDLKQLLNIPDKNLDYPHPSTITNHANQAAAFINEMKIGDLVITLDESKVAIGRITGDAVFSAKELQITVGKKTSSMPFKTRRKVIWGPIFNRSELPLNVEHTFRAHQTVFNIDRHWEFLYHLIYPVFADTSNLYFSATIRQKKDIDSYSVSQLLGYFSDFEAIFKRINLDDLDNGTLTSLINDFRASGNHQLICRAQFFSEGPVWWKLPVQWLHDYRRFIILIVFLEVTFGGTVGFMTFPGIITPAMREEVTKYILEVYKNRNMEEVKKELILSAPKYNTKPLELPVDITEI